MCQRTRTRTQTRTQTHPKPEPIKLKVPRIVHFALDKSNISPQSATVLNRVVEVLRQYPFNAINNPTAGATNVNFGTLDIPGGGEVQITFTTDIAATVTDGVYQNFATATYLDPTRTTANGTKSESYDVKNPGEDVIVASSIPTIRKSVRFLSIQRSHSYTYPW